MKTRRRSPSRSKPSGLSTALRVARFGALMAVAFGLASCAIAPTSRYPAKSDARPHQGVATAHTLPIHGVDISKWQGNVDWASLRQAGTKFAFIKATEGGDHVDSRFLENWWGAKKAGVPRGAYHFVFWCRSAQDQMAWFKKNVPNDPTALPPVLDVEWNGHSVLCPKKLPKAQALSMVQYMLDEMERYTGKRPIIYTDITFHREVLEGELPDYPHWVRSTAAEPHERYSNRSWTMWQYTTTGRVPGIEGDVDRNAFYGGDQEWAAFLATNCDPRQFRQLAARGSCTGTSAWAQKIP